jgi:polyhydroxyalkanoate synthesis repressor PhaR
MTTKSGDDTSEKKPVVVKKYANRRLYNTATSSYVTLDDLAKIIRNGGDFIVHDAKTGEDITRSVLAQIILEAEQKEGALLPPSFLRQLIGFYGDSMRFLVPDYLEQAMRAFAKNQEQMRKSFEETFRLFPMGRFEEMGKQNLALFEQALKMFAPFAREEKAAPSEGEKPKEGRLERLEEKIDALKRQLEALERERKGS